MPRRQKIQSREKRNSHDNLRPKIEGADSGGVFEVVESAVHTLFASVISDVSHTRAAAALK